MICSHVIRALTYLFLFLEMLFLCLGSRTEEASFSTTDPYAIAIVCMSMLVGVNLIGKSSKKNGHRGPPIKRTRRPVSHNLLAIIIL